MRAGQVLDRKVLDRKVLDRKVLDRTHGGFTRTSTRKRAAQDMRLIHASDLQIGKVFGFLDPESAVLLQDARQAVVNTLGHLAIQHGASAILLAGDIYDKQQPSQMTLAKPIEAMRRYPKVSWHLLPGNHDCVRENGLWSRLIRSKLPENVTLHLVPGAVKIPSEAEPPTYVLPAPLKFISSTDDLTSYMDREPTPEGAIKSVWRTARSRASVPRATPPIIFHPPARIRQGSPISRSATGIGKSGSTVAPGIPALPNPTSSSGRQETADHYAMAVRPCS